GEVVTPAQSLALAHDLRQSPKVEAVRLDLALRRRRAPGRGNHFRRRTLTARARLVYSGLGTRIFDAERPLRPREPGIVDDLHLRLKTARQSAPRFGEHFTDVLF